MDYKQMIAPCGVDCARCVHYLANENPAALVQVEEWSARLNIPIEAITCKGRRAHTGQSFSSIYLETIIAALYMVAHGEKSLNIAGSVNNSRATSATPT